jgi:hypothetical protein
MILMGRPDGTRVKGLSKTRKIMPLIMPGRNESAVYYRYDTKIERAEEMARDLSEKWNRKVTLFNMYAHSLFKTMVAYPKCNRFISGGRIYQRKGVHFSFSVKRQMSTKASITVVKKEFRQDFTLRDSVDVMSVQITRSRENKKNPSDREAERWEAILPFIFHPGHRIYRMVDEYLGILPRKWILEDPFYATAFLVNVGTFGLDTFGHHLYEHGNISFLMVIGKVREIPVVEDGEIVARRVLPVTISIDERVVDGYYLSNALEYLRANLEDPDRLLQAAEFIE